MQINSYDYKRMHQNITKPITNICSCLYCCTKYDAKWLTFSIKIHTCSFSSLKVSIIFTQYVKMWIDWHLIDIVKIVMLEILQLNIIYSRDGKS